MTTNELKQDIHQWVDSVQNDVTIVDLHTAVALIIEQQDMPLNENDPEPRERPGQVTGQIERGEYLTNEAMKQQVQQWLAK